MGATRESVPHFGLLIDVNAILCKIHEVANL